MENTMNSRETLLSMFASHGLDEHFDMELVSSAVERIAATGPHSGAFQFPDDIVQWLDDAKAGNHILAKRTGLNTLSDWYIDNESGYLSHRENRFFDIVGMRVTSEHREVMTWDQPILDNKSTGIIGLLMKKECNGPSFLMQAKAEPGNRNIVQIGPTVQFTQENYIENSRLIKPFLFHEFSVGNRFVPVWNNRQSEEGGRFYKEEHVHKILMLPEDMELIVPPQYRWLTYHQLRFFLHMGDLVNSCARSILSCLI